MFQWTGARSGMCEYSAAPNPAAAAQITRLKMTYRRGVMAAPFAKQMCRVLAGRLTWSAADCYPRIGRRKNERHPRQLLCSGDIQCSGLAVRRQPGRRPSGLANERNARSVRLQAALRARRPASALRAVPQGLIAGLRLREL